MFGRHKRTDAQTAQAAPRTAEAIITAATEPVLPPPPPIVVTPPPPPAPTPVVAAPPAPPAPAPVPDPSPAPQAAEGLSSADIRARTLLADSIARMELSLKVPPPPAPTAGFAVPTSSSAVEALADSVARTASEVARALEHVSSMCAMLSERLDSDREERRALTEAIARLGVTMPAPAEAPSTVLGGTVFPSEPEPAVAATTAIEPEVFEPAVVEPAVVEPEVIELESAPAISLVDEHRIDEYLAGEPAPEPIQAERPDTSYFASPPPARENDSPIFESDAVAPSASMFAAPPPAREPDIAFGAPPAPEPDVISLVDEEAAEQLSTREQPTGAGMWCRDDDKWIGGVEIADFVSDNGTIRYWLRRTADGQMLPRPFDATDLRFIRETSEA